METFIYFLYDRIANKPRAVGNNRRKLGVIATRLTQAADPSEPKCVRIGGMALPRFCVLTTHNNPDVDVSGLVIV